uniref:Uncharacterized protein n=1 Tax=Cacopsylla melanoneura TaxID=428564 RepID=A0A8D8UR96_9HEMI
MYEITVSTEEHPIHGLVNWFQLDVLDPPHGFGTFTIVYQAGTSGQLRAGMDRGHVNIFGRHFSNSADWKENDFNIEIEKRPQTLVCIVSFLSSDKRDWTLKSKFRVP